MIKRTDKEIARAFIKEVIAICLQTLNKEATRVEHVLNFIEAYENELLEWDDDANR